MILELQGRRVIRYKMNMPRRSAEILPELNAKLTQSEALRAAGFPVNISYKEKRADKSLQLTWHSVAIQTFVRKGCAAQLSSGIRYKLSGAESPMVKPKKNWIISHAVDSDAEALSECMHASYQGYLSRLGGIILPPMEVDYREEIRSYPVWVAKSYGIVVGGLILMPEEHHMTIANIAVHPDYQGKGLGRCLIECGEEEALKQEYSELRLATHIALTENISLYTHLGWSEIDRDEHRVYMRKLIDQYPKRFGMAEAIRRGHLTSRCR